MTDTELMLCLITSKSKQPFVFGDDGPSPETVRLIRPDGRIVPLNRDLFEDDEVELPASALTEAQLVSMETLNNELDRAAVASVQAASGGVTYRAARLTFYRDIIEPLRAEQSFTIECRDGTFTMTKRDFYDVFDHVTESDSYRLQGNYNYSKTPDKAFAFARE